MHARLAAWKSEAKWLLALAAALFGIGTFLGCVWGVITFKEDQ